MTEWFKNVCLNPIKFGLEQANYFAINTLTLILNLCAKRLLKIDMDQIIEKNECVNDRDNFYIYPLQLRDMEQDIGLNSLKIINCSVQDVVISVPWKSMLSDATEITIKQMDLDSIFIHKLHNTLYFSVLEKTGSYFSESISNITSNNDLINTFNDIKHLLSNYLNSINIQINKINIVLLEHFKVIINNVKYTNETVYIDNIHVESMNKYYELLIADKIIYLVKQNKFIIDNLIIDPFLFDYLPDFYTDDTENQYGFTLEVINFCMESLSINNLELIVTNNHIIVSKLDNVTVKDIFLFKSVPSTSNTENILTNKLLIYDQHSHTLYFEQILSFKLSTITELTNWIHRFSNMINCLRQKIIVVPSSSTNLSSTPNFNPVNKLDLNLDNIRILMAIGDDIIDLSAGHLTINDTINISNVNIIYDNVHIFMKNVIINENNEITLFEMNWCDDIFNVKSPKMMIIKSESKLDLHFFQTTCSNIIEVINFVNKLVDKLYRRSNSTLSPSHSSLINLHINESSLTFKYELNDIYILFHHGMVCINTKIGQNINADILMNNYLVGHVQASYLSIHYAKFESIKIYLDPDMFDKINYILGTLQPEHELDIDSELQPLAPNELNNLQKTMTDSFIVEDLLELESSINKATSFIFDKQLNKNTIMNVPNTKIFVKSFSNLRDLLINDYFINLVDYDDANLKMVFDSIHINLFDKLKKTPVHSNIPFLCIVLKNVHFNKRDEIVNIYNSNKMQTSYSLRIATGAIIDNITNNQEWKYFMKFARNESFEINISLMDNSCKMTIKLNPFIANIREETLIRFLAFFSNSHRLSRNNKPLYIEYFNISEVHLTLSYYPLILTKMSTNANILSVKDVNVILSSQRIKYVSMNNLMGIIIEHWKSDLSPQNILQFIPNIKLIKPCVNPLLYIVEQITKYFKQNRNKKKIRAITRSINKGTDFVTGLIKYGIEQVWDLFN